MKIRLFEQTWEERKDVSDWLEVSEEEYKTLAASRLWKIEVDHGKDYYLEQAALEIKRAEEAEREHKARLAKYAADREKKALERKRKQLEALKKELEG